MRGNHRRHGAACALVACAILLLPAPLADAGGPWFHASEGSFDCTTCHLAGSTSGTGSTEDALRREATRFCLGCHDEQEGVPDVLAEDRNGLVERSAGFFAAPGFSNPRGHDLIATRAGTSLSEGNVACTDCHDPHGRGGQRGLRTSPARDGEDVGGIFTDPSVVGVDRYERRHVAYGASREPADVAALCLSCHGSSASRHDGGTRFRSLGTHVSYTAAGKGNEASLANLSPEDRSAWEGWREGDGPRVPFVAIGASAFSSAREVSASTNAVFCLTCHQAHGSSHAFALREDPSRASTTICGPCHLLSARSEDHF